MHRPHIHNYGSGGMPRFVIRLPIAPVVPGMLLMVMGKNNHTDIHQLHGQSGAISYYPIFGRKMFRRMAMGSVNRHPCCRSKHRDLTGLGRLKPTGRKNAGQMLGTLPQCTRQDAFVLPDRGIRILQLGQGNCETWIQ